MRKIIINNWLHVALLFLVVAFSPSYAADVRTSERIEAAKDSGVWQVAEGETLLDIARTLFPQSSKLQNRFIKDVTGLNFEIFGSVDQNKFKPGVRIKLPDYALSETGIKARKKTEIPKPIIKPSRVPTEKSQPEKTKTTKTKATSKQKKPARATRDNSASERVQQARRSGKIRVAPGENIFRLARLFFPQRPKARQLFIQDVIKLNPEVFNNARINAIPAGAVLKLPSYVWRDDTKRIQERETKPLPDRAQKQPEKDQQTKTDVSDQQEKNKKDEMQQTGLYTDQYMSESELFTIDVGSKEDQLPGRRLLEMEEECSTPP